LDDEKDPRAKIMTDPLDVPILFMIFNRPSTTNPVFDRIKNAQPKKLYVAADGPRAKPGEAEACQEVRKIIDKIDWECEIHTLFRTENLGCKNAVRTAIDWFFENEEMGIILEDDCLADPSFFNYCKITLNKYKKEERVMMITGTSYLNKGLTGRYKFYFSQYYAIWGWATWRRAWLTYDRDMKAWPEMKDNMVLQKKYGPCVGSILESIFQSTFEGNCNTWDSQWFITCLSRNGLCVAPKTNLISNIGLDGVHFNGNNNQQLNVPTKSIGEICIFPPVEFNEKLDTKAYKNIFRGICPPLTRLYFWINFILCRINRTRFCNSRIPILGRLRRMHKI
jgi:hypothetical protein